jgi:hypothetical protein
VNKEIAVVKRFDFRLVLLVWAMLGASVFAQTSKGVVVGNIVDSNGALIVSATVKIINVSTGVKRDTVSAADGTFRIEAVDPGTYKVEVTSNGFKTLTRDNVIVTRHKPLNAISARGGHTVENRYGYFWAATSFFRVQDGARVNTLSRREITELPTPAGNPTNIVFTLPGRRRSWPARWWIRPGKRIFR